MKKKGDTGKGKKGRGKHPRHVKVFRYAVVQTVMMAYAGLVAGIIYSFGGLVIDSLVSLGWIATNETPGLSHGTILAFGALVGMPAYFAAFGFVTGIIGATVYNFVSQWFGRVTIDVEK